ncbi:MAG: phosphatidate cytidylyltransferase, partial [Candidatus Solibacter usitatus]|nr:phosphatidate cytidylyltransferase [Candidatus Solibacter usitatus]
MTRVLTALALIPVVVYVVLWGPAWLVSLVVAIFATLCYLEYLGIAQAYGTGPLGKWSLAAGLALLWVPREGLLLAVVLALAALTLEMRSADLRLTLPRASAVVLGLVYIFGSWKCAILLHAIQPRWLMFATAINWIGDAAAYYAGRRFGRHKLAPRISPAKSWEGSAAALLASMAFGAAYLGPSLEFLALSAGVNAVGQVGDLAESTLKRGAGVKDSGTLLPGHGGMLDRVDSTLFTLPAVLAYLQVLQSFNI